MYEGGVFKLVTCIQEYKSNVNAEIFILANNKLSKVLIKHDGDYLIFNPKIEKWLNIPKILNQTILTKKGFSQKLDSQDVVFTKIYKTNPSFILESLTFFWKYLDSMFKWK